MKQIISITAAITFLLLTAIIGVTSTSMQSEKPQILTEQQIQQKIKVDAKINRASMDIVQTFEINQSEYVQIDPVGGLSEFSMGQGFIKDKKKVQSILKEVISPNFNELPIGSVMPLILINKDGNEIILGYKQTDGTNVITVNKYQNDKWVKVNQKTQKGELPLSSEELKVQPTM